MKLINLTVIKLTVPFIVGIIIGDLHTFSVPFGIVCCSGLICSLFICKLIPQKTIKHYLFGTITYLSFFGLGILTTSAHDLKERSSHYSYYLKDTIKNPILTFRIREVLKPTLFHDKYIIEIMWVNSKAVSGKLLLNIKNDTLIPALTPDDILMTKSPIKKLKNPLNPHQFNYKNYLSKQYIFHQITTNNSELRLLSHKKHSINGWAAQFRNKAKKALSKHHFKTNELAIINALILGQRQDINTKITHHYIRAGAIHILAVSGLHVGILLLILNFLLKPLQSLKQGQFIKVLILLFVLWCFAIITGLSASVTRAVTMFSLLTIGNHLKRPVNIYNTLALSIFILLLFKPLFIFDIGFQLSYAAILSIVSIQPILERLWQPKWFVLKKGWQILTASFAAQMGVLPLSLFYFHQFPGLFFLSNLVILPFLGFILGYGILMIILAFGECLPTFLSKTYGLIINYLNEFIKWIALQDHFIFKDIPFNMIQFLTSYGIIIFFFRSIIQVKFKRLALLLMSIILFQIGIIRTKFNTAVKEFVIFHKSRKTIIAKRTNATIRLYSDSTNTKDYKIIKNYNIANRIDSIFEEKSLPVYKIQNKYLLVIDNHSIYNTKRFCADYLLLTDTPKINLSRVIDSINPTLIIADGSNYKSQISIWETTCKNKDIPFHYTGVQGAFKISDE